MATMRLATLSFLIIALAMKPLLITCKDVNDAVVVVDYEGNPILSNKSYYIRPLSFISGGIGLEYNSHSQYYIALQGSEIDPGLPVSFSPKLNISGVVHESSNLLIRFHVFKDDKSNQWKVNEKAEKRGEYLLSAGRKTVKDDWFQIVKSSKGAYKIMYCPGQSCKSVGVSDQRRLAITDHIALNVNFLLHENKK
ncbi:hypothetical protein ACFE04_007809 [Oxalis oulophora]